MSRDFSIYVTFDAQLSYQFVKKLVERGDELGFLFIDESVILLHEATFFLSTEQAVAQVIKIINNEMPSSSQASSLSFKTVDNTYCTLYFAVRNPFRMLVCTDHARRYKDDDRSVVDIVHYMKLILDLVQDCDLLSIKTYDSYFDDEELLRFL